MSSEVDRPSATTVDASPLLEGRDVSMEYPSVNARGSLRVLDRVNLSVGPGRMIGVSGRSGSGKTTLLLILAGLLCPSSGDVLWSGRSITSGTTGPGAAERRSHVGFAFQNGGLLAALTAAENVGLPLVSSPRREIGDRVAAALAAVELGGRSGHLPSQLSGGEVQRVALARALVAEPAVLIVDEPTANLDRRTADEIIDHLVALHEGGKALIVASHDPHLLEQADTVVELELGGDGR